MVRLIAYMIIKPASACTYPFSNEHFHRNVERFSRLNLHRRVLCNICIKAIGRWDKIDKHHVREKVKVQLLARTGHRCMRAKLHY